MEFSQRNRRQITIWLCALFLILIIDRWWNDMLLYQIQPAFFYSKMDVISWLFMYTGLHKLLLKNSTGWMILDSFFVLLPIIYLLLFLSKPKWATTFAWLWIIFNFVYIQCYTLYPTNSIEAHLAWMLLPFLFTCTTTKGFYLTFQFLRYFFIWFMFSAGLWKIWQHGIFNHEEMSAIIYMQHKEYLVTSSNWLSNFYYWLIEHSTAGYFLYLGSAVLELLFVVGFFTRRFDRLLIVLYFIFFLMDVLVMRIKYWEMAPFVVTLCYSRYRIPTFAKGSSSSFKLYSLE